jgi:epoxyqueuosine reductase
MKKKIEKEFQKLCDIHKRKGIIGFSSFKKVKLLPVQKNYLERKLSSFDLSKPVTAISLGVFYTPDEVESIPDRWVGKGSKEIDWNIYARACGELNRILNSITKSIAIIFGGISEQATLEGYTNKINYVEEYFDLCVSHRVFAESAGLGWRGKSGLIVTPEQGSALRLSTIFVPNEIKSEKKNHKDCGDCRACLMICPFLKELACQVRGPVKHVDYRQNCLMRLKNVGLENEVCGICLRVCWEQVKNKHRV